MGTDNELCAFSRLIFARSATGHPHFYVKPIFVGSKSVRRTKQNRKKKQNAIKCQSTWVWTVVVGTTNDGRPLVWVAVHLNCRGDPSLMLTSCQKKDGFRHWIVHCQEHRRHARLGMVWEFDILGLFRIDGKNTVSERFKNKRDLICISLEHITCRAGEDPVFIFNYVERVTRGQCLRKRMDGTDDVWRMIFLLWCYRRVDVLRKGSVCLFKIKVVLSLVCQVSTKFLYWQLYYCRSSCFRAGPVLCINCQ